MKNFYTVTPVEKYYIAVTLASQEDVDTVVYMLDAEGNRVKDAEGNYIILPS